MKKSFYIGGLLCFHISVFSQVGVNTMTPQSTLDVTAKGGASDKDGLQAPRLTRAQLTSKGNTLYGDAQKGSLVYITDISGGDSAGPRTNIDAIGYYYFDGSLWQKVGSISGLGTGINAENGLNSTANKIKLGGTLTGPTVITGVNVTNKLSVTADGVDAVNIDNNTLSIDAANHNVGVGTATPQKALHVKGGLQLVKELNVGGSSTVAGSSGEAGQVFKSGGLGHAPTWENELGLDLFGDTSGTLLSIHGSPAIAQEIVVRLAYHYDVATTAPGTFLKIPHLTDKIIDNKNLFTADGNGNSFTVEETGNYLIQSNFSLEGIEAQNKGNLRYGVIDNTTNKWVSYAIETLSLNMGQIRNLSNTRVAKLEVGKTYSFAISKEQDITGVNGTLRMSDEGAPNVKVTVFSVKRLD